MNNALEKQVGGDHYKKLAIQPMVFSSQQGYDACAHTILKYVTRWRDKQGIRDLEKAIHCAELRMADDIRPHVGSPEASTESEALRYCLKNHLDVTETRIIMDLESWVRCAPGAGDSTFGSAVIHGIQQLIIENGG